MRTALVLLALLPLTAQAADWVALPGPTGGDRYYYDRTKQIVEKEEITYWKKVLFRTPQPVKGGLAASALYRERIHCGDHTLRPLSYAFYAADGTLLELVESKDATPSPILPDSVGDVFETALCPPLLARLMEEKRLREEAERETRPPPAPVE